MIEPKEIQNSFSRSLALGFVKIVMGSQIFSITSFIGLKLHDLWVSNSF